MQFEGGARMAAARPTMKLLRCLRLRASIGDSLRTP
jgi:hypothetical protein